MTMKRNTARNVYFEIQLICKLAQKKSPKPSFFPTKKKNYTINCRPQKRRCVFCISSARQRRSINNCYFYFIIPVGWIWFSCNLFFHLVSSIIIFVWISTVACCPFEHQTFACEENNKNWIKKKQHQVHEINLRNTDIIDNWRKTLHCIATHMKKQILHYMEKWRHENKCIIIERYHEENWNKFSISNKQNKRKRIWKEEETTRANLLLLL